MAPAQRGWRHQALVPCFVNKTDCDAELGLDHRTIAQGT